MKWTAKLRRWWEERQRRLNNDGDPYWTDRRVRKAERRLRRKKDDFGPGTLSFGGKVIGRITEISLVDRIAYPYGGGPKMEVMKPGECPSCHGLNTSCPEGCGRDPETGELNGTRHDPDETHGDMS